MMKKYFFLFSLAFLFGSCEESAYFQKSFGFKNNTWDQNVKPKFVVEFQDTTKLYDFVITLRTTTDYKYSNLWIFLNTTPPVGKSVREPYEIKTTYPDGSWIGKETGTVVEHQLVFKRRRLPFKGKYKFVIEQGITEKKIDQILDVSLRVEEVTGNK
jgi:gliding motility-associated lipoprotein GldH